MCFPRQLHLQSIQVIFFIFLNKWFSVFWIQLRGHQGHFFLNFLFCVWTCKGGITKSNRMWCEMTASNVACHGSVRQTSLTSLQMENSLCCIVFHARGQVCSSLFLSVVVNTINPVTDWWDRDCLQGWFRRFILARGADPQHLRLRCFSSTLTFYVCDFRFSAVLPSKVFIFTTRWTRTVGTGLFLVSRETFSLAKVSKTAFPPFLQPQRKKTNISSSQY